MSPMVLIFIVLVFIAAFLLATGLIVPAFGDTAQSRKRLKQRLMDIEADAGEGAFISLIREDYLRGLPPFQRWLEELPGMPRLRVMIEQAGLTTQAWQVVVTGALFGAGIALALALFNQPWYVCLAVAALAAWSPIMRVGMQRTARMNQFEADLPDGIDLIKRALRAGQPFAVAIRIVGEDMEGPVGKEFRQTSADMNFGNDPRRALLGLLSRMPSTALMGLVTAVLLQRETGGNLAEVLEQISGVIRGRYRFQRRVRTLTAEGRMSAWVLSCVPFVLGGLLMLIAPSYLPLLFEDPRGQKMLVLGASLMVLGMIWMRKLIRIQV